MDEEQRLSLCMIVKNEEKWLRVCLESVKDVVDEIIIVDTGSTDGTRKIAAELGAVIYDFNWNDSFAEARNYGLDRATGDWILWLDADEEIERSERDYLRDILTAEDECYLGCIQLVNYYGSSPPDYNRSHLMNQYRLFRNDPKLRFRGAIHEQLDVEGLNLTQRSILALPVTLHHYGYMEEAVEVKGKKERNLYLLEKELEVEGHDPWLDYHYASELYRCGKMVEAFERVNTSIGAFLKAEKKPPSLAYKLKYSILLALGSFEGGWPGIEFAIQMYPDYVDLHFYKGIILMKLQKFVAAIEVFQHCLELEENHGSYLTMVGTGSFLAWYYIGCCQELLGEFAKAEEAYRKTLELSEDHAEARIALQNMGIAEFSAET
ncbi:glycosyltransferase [Paenibacillus albidus]|uniref:glycosyltransferase n=1 Tax=Paenibacillus albidus TaxID=2041023 RepID=UPI001BEADA0A|nr:glycosyltransferase [Paenibacillus albidus]MBT2287719.1 glycosyltransferase [Paenibacillus albidus]